MPSPGTTKPFNFRVTPEELERWAETAYLARKSRTQWARDVLNAAASGAPLGPYIPPAPTIAVIEPTKVRALAQELVERASATAVQKKGKCENRVPKGAFCKRCGQTHD